jgi:hypothetical protein
MISSFVTDSCYFQNPGLCASTQNAVFNILVTSIAEQHIQSQQGVIVISME